MLGFLRVDRSLSAMAILLAPQRGAKEKGSARWTISSCKGGVLHCEDVPLPEIAAAVGTPVYVYSTATMVRHAAVLRAALEPLARPPDRLCGQGQPERRGARDAGAAGPRRRRRLGRRISPRPRRRHRRRRRSSSPASARPRRRWRWRSKGGLYQFNLECRAEAEMLSRGGRVARARPRRSASGSIRTSRPAPTPRSRPARAENKFGIPIDAAPAAYRRAAPLARARGPGRRRPYRQPADRPRARSRRPSRGSAR